MAMKEIVLLALRAVRAFEASNQQHTYAQRDEHGEYASIHRDPMSQGLHLRSPIGLGSRHPRGFGISEKCYLRFTLDAIPSFRVGN